MNDNDGVFDEANANPPEPEFDSDEAAQLWLARWDMFAAGALQASLPLHIGQTYEMIALAAGYAADAMMRVTPNT